MKVDGSGQGKVWALGKCLYVVQDEILVDPIDRKVRGNWMRLADRKLGIEAMNGVFLGHASGPE